MDARPLLGRRICVVGTSGSGKTYVAQELAQCLGLRYISNDALIWRVGWEPVPSEERLEAFNLATREGGWTFDGNLGPSPEDELVLGRCETIVWLDLSRWQVMQQIARRTLRRVMTREPLWHGNVERWPRVFSRDSMVLWAWRTFSLRRRQYARMFVDPQHAHHARIHLRSRAEVDRWLASLRRTAG